MNSRARVICKYFDAKPVVAWAISCSWASRIASWKRSLSSFRVLTWKTTSGALHREIGAGDMGANVNGLRSITFQWQCQVATEDSQRSAEEIWQRDLGELRYLLAQLVLDFLLPRHAAGSPRATGSERGRGCQGSEKPAQSRLGAGSGRRRGAVGSKPIGCCKCMFEANLQATMSESEIVK